MNLNQINKSYVIYICLCIIIGLNYTTAIADLDDLEDKITNTNTSTESKSIDQSGLNDQTFDNTDLNSSKFGEQSDSSLINKNNPPKSKLKISKDNIEDNNKNLYKKKSKTITQPVSLKPIKWQAQGLKANKSKNIIELVNNVQIKQEDLKCNSDKAIIYLNNSNSVSKVIAEGNVKIHKKATTDLQAITARGEKAIYDNIKRRIVLTGNAFLWRGKDLVKGKEISFDIDTGWIYVNKVEGLVNSSKQNNKK